MAEQPPQPETILDPETLEPVKEGVKQALNEFEQPAADAEKVPLTPCPCGAVPEGLLVELQPRSKYGRVQGDCCGDWMIEFKAAFNEAPEQVALRAKAAWEAAQRSA